MAYPARLTIEEGEVVLVAGHLGTIVEILDLDTVIVSSLESGLSKTVKIADIRPYKEHVRSVPELDALDQEQIKVAKQRLEYIHPLLNVTHRTRNRVEHRAHEVGLHPSTLYDWLQTFESTKQLSSLASRKRSDRGKKRLPQEVEAIVEKVIEEEYLTRQKKSGAYICREIRRLCFEAELTPPHDNTVRKRLKSIPAHKVTAKRVGIKAAKEKYTESKGAFPGADWPLAVVQIDHTQLDIILVDDIHRQPIGRPWITLAMDVFSRMVTGFHVSLDPPSATSVGLCLSHSVLPKEKWMAERGIDGGWPCYGFPKTIHADNAKEFRGESLKLICDQYGMNLEWRPVARPNFGAHVERLLGTFAKDIHSLPGTTFSNTQERGKYDSEKRAAFTISEFETWLSVNVVQVYHCSLHSALSMSPIERYKQGIFGDDERPGSGLPDLVVDEEKLCLDFLPFVERSVQQYGVAVDKVRYWHDVLRPWINSEDPYNKKQKRKFKFRRDPRDISTIWFFDPEIQIYYPIPYRDTSHPPVSIWELREAKRKLSEAGRDAIDEKMIFEAMARLRELEESSQANTKAAKRTRQRRSMGIGATKRMVLPAKEIQTVNELEGLDDLQPFDDLEDI